MALTYERDFTMITVVCGVQSGDEAKGKICDAIMDKYDCCVRYSGSCNVGATVCVEGIKYKFNHLPVSILWNKPAFISSPCLIDPRRLQDEIDRFKMAGCDVDSNLRISPDCHLITQEHIDQDCQNEGTNSKVGSTKRGVGPCAKDKYGRKGVKIETLQDQFGKYFCDIPYELNRLADAGKDILFEGSQGTLLDIDHGLCYPHISTTSNIAGAACLSGIGPTKITDVIGVTKGYLTKVGTGPCPTLIEDGAVNDGIVDRGHEFGTVSGRRRKVAWLDLVALKYACQLNGCTSIALTKSDVLKGLTAKYCVAYELDGRVIDRVPMCKDDYWRCKPVYQEVEVKTGREFISIVEAATGLPVKYFSFGPGRSEIDELI
jgi:adenylosuccinate synthase